MKNSMLGNILYEKAKNENNLELMNLLNSKGFKGYSDKKVDVDYATVITNVVNSINNINKNVNDSSKSNVNGSSSIFKQKYFEVVSPQSDELCPCGSKNSWGTCHLLKLKDNLNSKFEVIAIEIKKDPSINFYTAFLRQENNLSSIITIKYKGSSLGLSIDHRDRYFSLKGLNLQKGDQFLIEIANGDVERAKENLIHFFENENNA